MDLLNGKAGRSSRRVSKKLEDSLVRTTPEMGPSLDLLKTEIDLHLEEGYYYSGTLTVSTKYKCKPGGRILANLHPSKQKEYLKSWIIKNFNFLSYIGFYEFTQRGVIHWHFICAHPLVKIENSTVRASIHKQLQEFGKVQQIEKISSSKAWIGYITKEYHPSLDNIQASSDFNLWDPQQKDN